MQITNHIGKTVVIFVVTWALIVASAQIAFRMTKENDHPDLTWSEFLNLETSHLTTKSGIRLLFIGLSTGFLFGFLNNAGVWQGLDALSVMGSGVKPSSVNNASQVSEIVNDLFITAISTYINIAIYEKADVTLRQVPLWASLTGTFLGSLVGIWVGKHFKTNPFA